MQTIRKTDVIERLESLSRGGLALPIVGSLSTVTDWGLVSALPGSPAVGDRCAYIADAGNGIIWDLIYDGSGTYPWKKLGGSPLRAFSAEQRNLNNQVAYVSLPTDPLSITVPLKGDYNIRGEGLVATIATAAALRIGRLSYAVGGVAASDTWCVAECSESAGLTRIFCDMGKETPHLALAAAAKIEEKGRTEGAYEIAFSRRRLWANPVRVG